MNKLDDLAWSAEDVVREYGEVFLRDLLVEMSSTSQPPVPSAVVLSVPPNIYPKNMAGGSWVSGFHHLKANPLPRKVSDKDEAPLAPANATYDTVGGYIDQPRTKWPTHLAQWQEELLVIWWRANFAENALNALVEAHRPMVISMAKRLNRRHLRLLVEYGMLGLRIAAGPQRPSKTKKGKLAGFDPAKGYRFSTYGRRVAARYMAAAVQAMRFDADTFSECLGPRFEDKPEEFAAWAKTPIPVEIRRRVRDERHFRRRPSEIAEIGPQLVISDYDAFAREEIYQVGTERPHPTYPCLVISTTALAPSTPLDKPYCTTMPAGCLVYWQEYKKPRAEGTRRKNISKKTQEREQKNRREYYRQYSVADADGDNGTLPQFSSVDTGKAQKCASDPLPGYI
jgi:hypothetical protein